MSVRRGLKNLDDRYDQLNLIRPHQFYLILNFYSLSYKIIIIIKLSILNCLIIFFRALNLIKLNLCLIEEKKEKFF